MKSTSILFSIFICTSACLASDLSNRLIKINPLVTERKTKSSRPLSSEPRLRIPVQDERAADERISDKGVWATKTTCNVLRLLKECNIPVAFKKQLSDTQFSAVVCKPIDFQIVVWREAHDTYLKRNPWVQKGYHFPQAVEVEFFLKTSDGKWRGKSIDHDNPFIRFRFGKAELLRPDQPLELQTPFDVLSDFPLSDRPDQLKTVNTIARKAFLVLEKAWHLQNIHLADFKVEFGFDTSGNVVLTDVINHDSWHIVENGVYIDEQLYKATGNLQKIAELYRRVAELTDKFFIPKQQLILWCGSTAENLTEFKEKLSVSKSLKLFESCCLFTYLIASPVDHLEKLNKLITQCPLSVLVTDVRTNNLVGEIRLPIPVIAAQSFWKESPEGTWSLSDALYHAIVAALQILALHNPALYAQLRFEQEEHMHESSTLEI
jgi:phosphoribosylaminoimidazole-succinocarboxamide synthase